MHNKDTRAQLMFVAGIVFLMSVYAYAIRVDDAPEKTAASVDEAVLVDAAQDPSTTDAQGCPVCRSCPTKPACEPTIVEKTVEVPVGIAPIAPGEPLRAAYERTLTGSSMGTIAERKCFPKNQYVCGAGGCRAEAPTAYYLLDYGVPNLYRCTEGGCSDAIAQRSASGAAEMFTAQLPDGLHVFTLSGSGTFSDVAIKGASTVTVSGSCE